MEQCLLLVPPSSGLGSLSEAAVGDDLHPSLTRAAVLLWYPPVPLLGNADGEGRRPDRSEPRSYLEELDPDAGKHELQ